MLRNADTRNRILLLVLALLLWAPRLRGPIDLRYDAGVYYVTGAALAEGKGYRLLNEPGEILAVQYPPLLPALVAVHQWALGTNDPSVVGQALRISYCLIFLAYIVAVYGMARRLLSPGQAFLVGLITALLPHSVFLSDLLFAEIPFALVSVLFVLSNQRSDRPGYLVLTGVLGSMAFLLRTAGIALLGAWVAESLLQKRWKQAALRAVLAAAPVIAWQGYVSHVTSTAEYSQPAYAYQRARYLYYNVPYFDNTQRLVDPFVPELGAPSLGDLAERFGGNLGAMPRSLGDGVMEATKPWELLLKKARQEAGLPLPLWLAKIPSTIVGCLIVAGLIQMLTRREWFVPLYVGASVALICLTPWPGQFVRYLTPLTPFLAILLLRSLGAFQQYSQGLPRRWRKTGLVVFVTIMAGVLATQAAIDVHAFWSRHERGRTHEALVDRGHRLFYYGPDWTDFDAATAWLKANAEPHDVIATSAPHWVYLNTNLKAVMVPMEFDPVKGQQMLDSVPVRYAVVDQLEFLDISRRYLDRTITHHPQLWRLVYESPAGKTRIYQRQ